MKFGAAILMVAFLAFSAFAGARVVVPSLLELDGGGAGWSSARLSTDEANAVFQELSR